MNLLIVMLAATVISSAASPSQSQRIMHLEDSLLGPCCYTQPVSKHMSDVSLGMRKEISQMVLAGQSDQAILNRYKALYGLQILVDPEGNFHKVVYGLPPIALGPVGRSLFPAALPESNSHAANPQCGFSRNFREIQEANRQDTCRK